MPLIRSTLLVLLLSADLTAAISASTVWEVRTAGADTNGGGFVATGTDMSVFDNKNAAACTSCQSATVNISTTDAVAAGTTTITSVTGNFSSALVGNIVRFNGGTGSIAAVWRQVVTFTNSTTIVLDASIAASTGMTMNIGGALLTPAQASTNSVTGNVIWIKSGTYTSTTTTNILVSVVTMHGYHTTRGDEDGTQPLMTSATNSIDIISVQQTTFTLINMNITSTAATRGNGIQATTAHTTGHLIVSCLFSGLNNAINGDNIGAHFRFNSIALWNVEIKNSIGKGVIIATGGTMFSMQHSYVHNNGGNGIDITSPAIFVQNSIFYLNTGIGATLTNSTNSPIIWTGNNVDANTSDGLSLAGGNSPFVVDNSAFTNNGGFGVNATNASNPYQARVNAYCASGCTNTSGARNNLPVGIGDVSTLTATPYTSAGTNWALNGTANSGAALKAAGFPGALISSGTGFKDIGALQSQAAAAATQRAYGSVQ